MPKVASIFEVIGTRAKSLFTAEGNANHLPELANGDAPLVIVASIATPLILSGACALA